MKPNIPRIQPSRNSFVSSSTNCTFSYLRFPLVTSVRGGKSRLLLASCAQRCCFKSPSHRPSKNRFISHLCWPYRRHCQGEQAVIHTQSRGRCRYEFMTSMNSMDRWLPENPLASGFFGGGDSSAFDISRPDCLGNSPTPPTRWKSWQ